MNRSSSNNGYKVFLMLEIIMVIQHVQKHEVKNDTSEYLNENLLVVFAIRMYKFKKYFVINLLKSTYSKSERVI